jgi:hypothetical protein
MEILNDPQTRLINLIEERKGWEKLTSTPEWLKLVTTLQGQADDLQRNIIYHPLTSLDEIYLQEFRKGQLEGRLSVTVTAETILSDLDFEISRLKEQLDAGTDTTSGAGFRSAP